MPDSSDSTPPEVRLAIEDEIENAMNGPSSLWPANIGTVHVEEERMLIGLGRTLLRHLRAEALLERESAAFESEIERKADQHRRRRQFVEQQITGIAETRRERDDEAHTDITTVGRWQTRATAAKWVIPSGAEAEAALMEWARKDPDIFARVTERVDLLRKGNLREVLNEIGDGDEDGDEPDRLPPGVDRLPAGVSVSYTLDQGVEL